MWWLARRQSNAQNTTNAQNIPAHRFSASSVLCFFLLLRAIKSLRAMLMLIFAGHSLTLDVCVCVCVFIINCACSLARRAQRPKRLYTTWSATINFLPPPRWNISHLFFFFFFSLSFHSFSIFASPVATLSQAHRRFWRFHSSRDKHKHKHKHQKTSEFYLHCT